MSSSPTERPAVDPAAPGRGAEEAGGTLEVVMPQMGVSVAEGTIVEWRKQPGDAVEADETLADVTTDKVDVEIPCPASGRLGSILVEAGETVVVGTPIAEIDTATNGVAAGPVAGEGVSPDFRPDSSASGDTPIPAPPAGEAVGPLRVVPTPGHAADHVTFVIGDVCFCGDLVLGRGSSIVPPAAGGGSLTDYMESLARVRALGPALMCPGHGPWIEDPEAKIDEYVSHRLQRERKLVAALERGERSRQALLDAAWGDVPAAMRPAAALAMQAHLEKLEAEGRLSADLEA